jgi:Uncharacterized protein conserved in bacteria (DUF2219)
MYIEKWITALLLLVLGSVSYAESYPSCDSQIKDKIGWSFNWENDLGITDEKYTNGMLYQRKTLFEPCVTLEDGNRYSIPSDLALEVSTDSIITSKGESVGFGITMYTPTDIKSYSVQLNDRPYSGLMYLSKGYLTSTLDKKRNLERNVLHSFSFGCIGPCALQGEAQSALHGLLRGITGSDDSPADPKGWDNQIRNELAFIYTYDDRKMFFSTRESIESSRLDKTLDATRIYKILAGNIFDTVEAGVLLRYGVTKSWEHFPDDIPKIIKLEPERASFERPVIKKLPIREKYFYIRSQARVVLYNATLMGGLIDRIRNDKVRSVHTVSARPGTIDFEIGYSHENSTGLIIDISLASRSTEYEEKEWEIADHVWLQFKFSKMLDI